MARRIPGIPDNWQNFFLSIIFHLLFPLLPLGIEYWHQGSIDNQSITLMAAVYSITVGFNSTSKLMFGFGVVISIIFSIAYGVNASGGQPLTNSSEFATVSIIFMFLSHVAEKWNLHVVDKSSFWDFK